MPASLLAAKACSKYISCNLHKSSITKARRFHGIFTKFSAEKEVIQRAGKYQKKCEEG